MRDQTRLDYIGHVLETMPQSWLDLTTHRLDIYDEKLAKTQFLAGFEALFQHGNFEGSALRELPTAYDYIRLGHPLSCILEWGLAGAQGLEPANVISFSSQSIPVLAILRKNHLANVATRIIYEGAMPHFLRGDLLNRVYGYQFESKSSEALDADSAFAGSTIFISQQADLAQVELGKHVDFHVYTHPRLGSVLFVNGEKNASYIPDIQHVRRRETIAMTPANCLSALQAWVGQPPVAHRDANADATKAAVLASIKTITGTTTQPLVASSGLSTQYAIMMGLVHHALDNHPGKAIKFIVPPNCYGGTNDQARRVAACIPNVEVVDLPVDGDNEMVQSIDVVLANIANQDAIPYIIAEIPTNPRVEVPDLLRLKEVLSAVRKTARGDTAVDPVFILDQTFCPNVLFLGEGEILSTVRTLSYVSGSKFPSGGKCTAGYCVGNARTEGLMAKVALHLALCDNEATALQYELLAAQLPSMKERIQAAYLNTREFVDYIHATLPAAKINFVSHELAAQGFTPSVFSLDLPTTGDTDEEKEAHKRALNLKLINLMITEIPHESKFCVSYGQLQGCYWTVPATSTQGTTKEGDKDYIVRVALSPSMDLGLHKQVFRAFVDGM